MANINPGKIKINTYLSHRGRGVDVFISTIANGREAVARTVEMHTIDDGEYVEPTFVIEQQEAQQLMDELWQCGLRPSEGSGSAGSLRATENHLKDMQKISFQLLDSSINNNQNGE